MYVIYIMYVAKKMAVWGLTTLKSPIGVIYCLLVEFNCQKRNLLCQMIHSGMNLKAFYECNKRRVPRKLYYSKSRHIGLQYCYRYSLYWQCLVHTGCVFCGTPVIILIDFACCRLSMRKMKWKQRSRNCNLKWAPTSIHYTYTSSNLFLCLSSSFFSYIGDFAPRWSV